MWHDRRKYVDEPLFPSYVFICLDSMQAYYEGLDAEGVPCYVKIGKEMARAGWLCEVTIAAKALQALVAS